MLRKRRKWRRSGEEAGGPGSQGEEVRSFLYINKFTARIKCESMDGNYKVSSLCESSLFKKKKQAAQHRVTQEECELKKTEVWIPVASQLCDFVDVIQPFRAHVPSSVKWRLSQDQMKYFREQCFPDHPNKNTNLLIIHLFFFCFIFLYHCYVCLLRQPEQKPTDWVA